MPCFRNVSTRRSRRLSRQDPLNYNEDVWEDFSGLSSAPDQDSPYVIPYDEDSTRTSPASPPSRSSQSRSHPTKGRRHDNHVPRPPNAFILFRSDFWLKQRDTIAERDHRQISRLAAATWNNLATDERVIYQERAAERKLQHEAAHPDYRYKPAARGEKPARRRPRSSRANPPTKLRSAQPKRDGLQCCLIEASHTSPPVATISASPSIKAETSPNPELDSDMPLVVESEQQFVPTSAIPPLDLNATPKMSPLDELPYSATVYPEVSSTYPSYLEDYPPWNSTNSVNNVCDFELNLDFELESRYNSNAYFDGAQIIEDLFNF